MGQGWPLAYMMPPARLAQRRHLGVGADVVGAQDFIDAGGNDAVAEGQHGAKGAAALAVILLRQAHGLAQTCFVIRHFDLLQ